MIRYFQSILAGFAGGRTTLEDVITDGVSLVGRFSMKGHHDGPFMGVAPTGREVEIRALDIWRVKDGRLIEHWGETNIPRWSPSCARRGRADGTQLLDVVGSDCSSKSLEECA